MAEDVFDPYFIQTLEKGAADEAVAATLRTSRLIVLTQQGKTPLGKAVPVSETGDLTVYGDLVRVSGIIKAPGRTVKIVCRRLEFHPGSDGTSGINVAGIKGDDSAPAKALAAEKGDDGTKPEHEPVRGPEGIGAPKYAKELAGKCGANGANGGDGGPGGKGGTIEIYCDTLTRFAPVSLMAQGGRGGDGAQAQQGGRGGNGCSGYKRKEDIAFAHGGQGGCGGNGGDGGQGGKGGDIKFYFINLDTDPDGKHKVTFRITGGDGGNGGQAGEGGQGGNGGTPSPYASYPERHDWYTAERYVDGADSGGGGICGLPGYGGPVGHWGTLRYCHALPWPFAGPPTASPKMWVQTIVRERERYSMSMPGHDGKPGVSPSFDNPDKCAKAGTPGSPAEMRGKPPPGEVQLPQAEGKSGGEGKPNMTRKPKGARTIPGPELDPEEAICWNCWDWAKFAYEEFTHKELAAQTDVEQLWMLFDHLRTRYLLTDPEKPSDSVRALLEGLQWLVLLAEAKKENELLASATATFNHLRLGCNIFGKDAKFAVLGRPEKYKKDLGEMVGRFADVEAAYVKLSGALNVAAERHSYLENVKLGQNAVIVSLEELEKEKLKGLKGTLAEIQTLEVSRDNFAESVSEETQKLIGQILSAIGLTASDIFAVFNQLSFTNREFHNQAGEFLLGGAAAAGGMVLSQLGDLAVKATENVATDTGGSVNKKYVIRRLEFLGKDVNTWAGLKEARNGLLKTDANAEYPLLATREQFEAILSNFYETYPPAKKISHILDEYIETVKARNQKVEEYNQLLTDIYNVRTELNTANTQRDRVTATLQGGAQPGLPDLAKFGRAIHRHAWEQCVKQLYMASRVYTMQSLDLYDVFANVLGKLGGADAAELNSSALDTGLIDLISKMLETKQSQRTNCESFVAEGQHCWRMLTAREDKLLFAMLKAGKSGKFRILPASSETDIDHNPFAGMADVRLSHIRCMAEGMKTTDGVQVLQIRHPGTETFVREDDRQVQLHHNDVLHECRYNAKTGVVSGGGALDKDHDMIGPFCEWEITIPAKSNAGLELPQLQSIRVEFQGTYRGFTR